MDDILLMAYAFSLLTYYLGVFMYSLPIPIYGVKKWAPILLRDGIYSLILVFSYHTIVSIMYYLYSMLGHDWASLTSWLLERLAFLINLKLLVATVSVASSSVGVRSFIDVFVSPISHLLSYIIVAFQAFYLLSKIIQLYHLKILLLGILLFAIPFRLARWAGAFFIAFALVFFVGMPLLPLFVSTFSPSNIDTIPYSLQEEEHIVFFEGRVVNRYGEPLRGGQLVFTDKEGKELASYIIDLDGTVKALPPEGGIPLNREVDSYIIVDGIKLQTLIRPSLSSLGGRAQYTTSIVKLTFTAVDVVWSPKPYTVVVLENECAETHVNTQAPSIFNASIHPTISCPLLIAYPENSLVKVHMYMNKTVVTPVLNTTSTWGGQEFRVIKFVLKSNESYYLHVSISKYPRELDVQVPSRGYMEKYLGGALDLRRLDIILANFLVSWIILPISYYILLISITTSLAYVIAGARERIPIPLRVYW